MYNNILRLLTYFEYKCIFKKQDELAGRNNKRLHVREVVNWKKIKN